MTAIAALVAEAIAKAEAETPAWTEDEMPRFGVTREEMILDVETDANEQKRLPKAERFPGTEVVRRDVFDAALAHLATKAAEAEGRAERAEADLRRMETRALTFGAALQGIAASGDDKPTNASMFAEAVLLVEKNAGEEAPRG